MRLSSPGRYKKRIYSVPTYYSILYHYRIYHIILHDNILSHYIPCFPFRFKDVTICSESRGASLVAGAEDGNLKARSIFRMGCNGSYRGYNGLYRGYNGL